MQNWNIPLQNLTKKPYPTCQFEHECISNTANIHRQYVTYISKTYHFNLATSEDFVWQMLPSTGKLNAVGACLLFKIT